MRIDGVQWDAGNWPKCGTHGVTRDEIEAVLRAGEPVVPDPNPSEDRWRTVGRNEAGRHVFVVFTTRAVGRRMVLRPVSARYMHAKEIARYEEAKALAFPKERR